MSVAEFIPTDAPYRVRTSTLARWFGVTNRTIKGWWESGRIPKPIRLGPRTSWHIVAKVKAALERYQASLEASEKGVPCG